MRLIEALPETEQKIESGELSLTAAAKAQTFIMLEKKAKRHISTEEKREIVNACTSKSTREVERELAKRNPEMAKVETVKPVGRDRFLVSFSISEETEEKMKRLKGLFAHTNPNMTIEELFEKLLELGLEKFDPLRKSARSLQRRCQRESNVRKMMSVSLADSTEDGCADVSGSAKESTRNPSPQSFSLHAHETAVHRTRYIPAESKHAVWRRNGSSGCEFVSESSEICGSQHALQIDHIEAYSRGGSHDGENLRVVCTKHNRFAWSRNLRSSMAIL